MSELVVGAEDARSTRVQRAELPLYVNRIKVYPKSVHGLYRRIKWAMLIACLSIYYVTPWLRWNRGEGLPDQAVLIDMGGRRAFFFMIEIWPQEVYYLTGLLILGAFGLFLVTALMGRVWCGYFCPQTVWTDLFMWVERLIEGDRNQRMRLDKQPLGAAKAIRKVAKHAAWLAISVATGGAWVLYFNDAPSITRAIATLQAPVEVYFFVGLFSATTYTLAGWAREQVCTYMCPWPRFQAAMLDEHSFIVTYQSWRGEPRGSLKKGGDFAGRGDCVACNQCVAVCPTGIDIRDGQQLECIGCGLCIDACNDVMAKVARPFNLITFSTLAAQQARAEKRAPSYPVVRARTVIYAVLVLIVAGVMAAALLLRSTVELTVLRDRSPLFVTLSDGSIRNTYTLKVLNKSAMPVRYALSLDGLPAAHLELLGDGNQGGAAVIDAPRDGVATVRAYVTLPRSALTADSLPLTFAVAESGGAASARRATVFLGPHGGR
jgi:cytochrome c oxidase accessory protein FixG